MALVAQVNCLIVIIEVNFLQVIQVIKINDKIFFEYFEKFLFK